jgi:hypothetical protein
MAIQVVLPIRILRVASLVAGSLIVGGLQFASGQNTSRFFSATPTSFNGTKFELIASFDEDRDNPKLKIDWKLTYTGKRLPFVILKPSLKTKTGGLTVLKLHCAPSSGDGVILRFPSPDPEGIDGDAKKQESRTDSGIASPLSGIKTLLPPLEYFVTLERSEDAFQESWLFVKSSG